MTTAQLNEYVMRQRKRIQSANEIDDRMSDGCEEEAALHAEIIGYCRRHRYAYFHGSMSTKTHRTPGEPDFVVIAAGNIYLVECKTRTGKLSDDQRAIAKLCSMNGHTVHVIRHFREFLDLLGRDPEQTTVPQTNK